jgi:thiamine kinase-like enzyme
VLKDILPEFGDEPVAQLEALAQGLA